MSDSTSKEERAESVSRQMEDTRDQNAGQVTTPVEESPVRPDEVTDDAPDSPKGVGDSPNRSGEEIKDRDGKEPGRHDGAPDPVSGRPTGTSDERDNTGI